VITRCYIIFFTHLLTLTIILSHIGTHVAGTIAAINDGNGVRGVVTNNPKLHIVKAFGDDCSWAYVSSLVFALEQCKTAEANIVSMSLGGSFKSRTEQKAFDKAYNQGILSIAAAGNDVSPSVPLIMHSSHVLLIIVLLSSAG
jgi:subtilisin family serine protease